MSFKCSIFGHTYGDSEVEREREEDGNEVVITIRETETCERCGEVRVVSENKEVTTLETAADIVADDLQGDDDTQATAPAESAAEQDTQPPAESVDSPSGPAGTEPADAETQTGDVEIPDAESDEAADIDSADHPEDDAVILDEDDEDDKREPGEWPEEAEADDGGETETEESAESASDTTVDDREPGEWPDDTEPDIGEDEENWDLPPEVEPHPETEQPTVESTGSAITVPEGEFYCPNCEFSTPVDSSSLRAGDFCPECHQTTLEHHEE